MSFELMNASVIFQSYINTALREYLNIFALIYQDDILIYFSIEVEHTTHVRSILVKLRQYRLFVKLKKCEFSVFEICFLRFLLSVFDIAMKSDRIVTIRD